MSKIYKINKLIILLLISNSCLGQVIKKDVSLADYITMITDINKVILIDFVKDDYLKKDSDFINETDITGKSYEKRNSALKSIKLITTNPDTTYYCDRGLRFNENQIALYKINNIIKNSNFENPNNKNIESLENLKNQLEGLPKLEEGTKLNERKKQLKNLCDNYIEIGTTKLSNSLKIRFNKAEIDYKINELKNLPVLNENVSLENDKKVILEIYQNYESKIEKLKKELENKTSFDDNPSSDIRNEIYDDLKKEYKDYPYLVDVIEKSKKKKTAFRTEFSMQTEQNIEDSKPNTAPLEKKALTAKEIKEQETKAAEKKNKDSIKLEKEKKNYEKK